jgi:ABC-2 type transport system permease protein
MTAAGSGASKSAPSVTALAKVIVHKRLMLLVRYPVNTASQYLSLVLIFLLVFLGGRAVAGPALTESLDGIIVGFFLFTLTMTSYSGITNDITSEAQWGTLERLYMSPHRFGVVIGLSTLANIALSFLWGAILLGIMMALTGRWLTVDPLTILPLVSLTLMSVLGIGFLFGGLAIVYKRIGNVFSLLQFGFIGLIAAPVGDIAALRLLPVAHGSYLTRVAMEQDVRLWEFPAWELGLLVATATAYLTVGYLCFSRLTTVARKRGVMGHY